MPTLKAIKERLNAPYDQHEMVFIVSLGAVFGAVLATVVVTCFDVSAYIPERIGKPLTLNLLLTIACVLVIKYVLAWRPPDED